MKKKKSLSRAAAAYLSKYWGSHVLWRRRNPCRGLQQHTSCIDCSCFVLRFQRLGQESCDSLGTSCLDIPLTPSGCCWNSWLGPPTTVLVPSSHHHSMCVCEEYSARSELRGFYSVTSVTAVSLQSKQQAFPMSMTLSRYKKFNLFFNNTQQKKKVQLNTKRGIICQALATRLTEGNNRKNKTYRRK